MKIKFICIIILTILTTSILSSNVYAGEIIREIFNQVESWDTTGRANKGTTLDTRDLNDLSDRIFSLFLAVGTVIAVIVGAILGIQFMTAGINKKVEVQQALMGYVISCIIMFSAFGIWRLILLVMGNVTG